MYEHDREVEKALWRLANGAQDVADGKYLPLQDAADQQAGLARAETPEDADDAQDRGAGGMRTLLRRFAERFTEGYAPVLAPLDELADALKTASQTCRARTVLPGLHDLRHQLRGLIDKVAEHQAYALIFGPLKSGKSTFMNAMCAAYVSEVTSLPAYPCLVHVRHAEVTGYVVTRYDGEIERIDDPQHLRNLIDEAHRKLTERIREVEADGSEFDPIGHMPEAIRRIDVLMPAEALETSRAVLVDTPGLYSRMKFGYDRMTREFRNSAACAVFVVKTDNLFLEQVFAEFEDLLELFSRVFLVVNIDGAKKDLCPDGSLEPSLESRDPERIVEAFKTLTMSATLRRAADEDRLRIYPVDLLKAAGDRIRGGGSPSDAAAGDFDRLLQDLVTYLNSNDYLREFLQDSLRRAGNLLGELDDVAGHESVRDLFDQAGMLRREREAAERRDKALNRLGKVDWDIQTDALGKSLSEQLGKAVGQVRERTALALAGAIEGWFESDRSLGELEAHAGELLSQSRREIIARARELLGSCVDESTPDKLADTDVQKDLRQVELDLSGRAKAAVDDLKLSDLLVAASARIDSAEIPVRRRIWDWLLLRTRASVRKRLFGPAETPENPIPAATKARQLGEAGREALRRVLLDRLEDVARPAGAELPGKLTARYAATLSRSISTRLEEEARATRKQLAELKGLLAETESVVRCVGQLETSAAAARRSVDRLREQFVEERETQAAE